MFIGGAMLGRRKKKPPKEKGQKIVDNTRGQGIGNLRRK